MRPLITVDRNLAFARLEDGLGPGDLAERDRLLVALLICSVQDVRRCIGLPTIPTPAPASAPVTTTSTRS